MKRRETGEDGGADRASARPQFLLAVALLCSGIACFGPMAFQSPQVLRSGQGLVGAGATGDIYFSQPDNVMGLGDLCLYGRMGLGPQTDIGLKLVPDAVTLDAKYQFTQRGLLVAGDVAVIGGWYPGFFDASSYPVFAVAPLLLFGEPRIWSGVGVVAGRGVWGRTGFDLMPRVLVGAAIGRRFQVIPELDYYWRRQYPTLFGGIGLQFRLW